jgi:Dolichyl-phosphate-mannose-protein mannosyltransferase
MGCRHPRGTGDDGLIGQQLERRTPSYGQNLYRIFAFSRAVPLGMLLLAVLALFLTAPRQDNFWWTDTPAHAMNGALIRDYLLNSQFTSPIKFATNYYLHYPALTIGLYPPVFYLVEAAVYLVVGVSHFAAQLTVTLFTAILAYSLYRMFRTAFSPPAAGGAALFVLSTPVILLWSRQIMLDVPSLALLVAATAVFLRFLEEGSARWLYASVLLLCVAVYTKQFAVFAVVPFAVSLIFERGWAVLRQRSTWCAAALGFTLLFLLAAFTWVFAPHNFEGAAGIGLESKPSSAVSLLLWYARELPEITGPVPILASLGYFALLIWKGWDSPQERRLAVLMIAWFVAGYLFLSAIVLREERYGMLLAVPLAMFTMALIVRLLPRAWAGGSALVIGTVAFVVALAINPAPRISGYDAVAEFLIDHADKDSVVLFHGFRSPNLVFSLRAQSPSPNLYLMRSEKMLLDYKISRAWGVSDRALSRADLEKLVDRYGIAYVAFQPDFWTDLPSMAALQDFIYLDRFTKVAEFPIDANVPTNEKKIVVFRNNRPTHPDHPGIELDMPLLRGKISGTY